MATAVSHLAWLLPGDTQEASRDAQTVLFLVLNTFLRAQDPVAATALAHEWEVEHIHAEGHATREAVRSTGESIVDRLSASQAFTEHVRSLHPWRRDEAIAIREWWPTLDVVVQEVTAAEDRGALLRQWAEQPPTWYAEAPAKVACWLGELAVDYGQRSAAAQFIGAGLDRGAFPSGYWEAQRAIQLLEDDPSEAQHILESFADEHPLARCLLAGYRESWQEGIDVLSDWSPESAEDRALKLQLLARLTLGAGDLNGGVTLALQAAEIQDSTGSAVTAAELLLSRGRYGETIHRLADAEKAAALAIRARNARRTWQGDSVAAAVVAVKAAALAGNHARAWALTQPPPGGDATEAEAADARLRREAALLAALTGRFEDARRSLEGADEPFTEAEITALEHTAQGETAEAVTAWKTALDVAGEDADSLAAAMGLAELGASLPDLGQLEESHPDAVHEIRTVQRAMAEGGENLEALRAGAGESPVLTLNLAQRHSDRGEPRMAAEVLKAGAERWSEPRMMLMAARRYREAEDLERARDTAESALPLGGPDWAGEFDTRALLFEIHDATGHWEEATQQARTCVTLDPHDPNARWALVHCLVRRGDLAGAWNALTPEGDLVAPRDRHDAFAWIALAARYDTSPQFVPRALATMRRWPDDEQLSGVFIGQLYTGLQREELTPTAEDLAALHAATDEYTERFPDSPVFRAVPVRHDDPLAPVAGELRKKYEALEGVLTKVRGGGLPLGMLTEATGHSYAEASLRRAAGFVCCHDPAREAQERGEVEEALDHPVVIDTTAAHTLTLLDADTRSQLLAAFAQVLATDGAYRDALRGHESLGLQSTMTVGWDPRAGQPTVNTIDESRAAELAGRAEQLCGILRTAVRRPWPELRTLQDLSHHSEWMTSLDMAATDGLPYWCDDAVLRSLAASLGVATFDTVDLLRHLADEGRIERELLTVTEATLLHNYYADLGFDRAALDLAATMDGWRPRGAALAVTRRAAWTHPSNVVRFVFAAVEQQADEALDDIEGWITAAAAGLVHVAPDEQAAGTNLGVLLRQCLAQPWMRPDRLPVVLRAVRSAQEERPGTTDPVEPAFTETYRALAARHGHALAASLLMSLVQFTSDTDRFTACRVALTHPD